MIGLSSDKGCAAARRSFRPGPFDMKGGWHQRLASCVRKTGGRNVVVDHAVIDEYAFSQPSGASAPSRGTDRLASAM
jgi:hypothetical protein